MELKGEGNPSSPVTPVKIPDCPVPASLLDELLKPSASVNKEPLNNLHSCLRQLKYDRRPGTTFDRSRREDAMRSKRDGSRHSHIRGITGVSIGHILGGVCGEMFRIICHAVTAS